MSLSSVESKLTIVSNFCKYRHSSLGCVSTIKDDVLDAQLEEQEPVRDYPIADIPEGHLCLCLLPLSNSHHHSSSPVGRCFLSSAHMALVNSCGTDPAFIQSSLACFNAFPSGRPSDVRQVTVRFLSCLLVCLHRKVTSPNRP